MKCLLEIIIYLHIVSVKYKSNDCYICRKRQSARFEQQLQESLTLLRLLRSRFAHLHQTGIAGGVICNKLVYLLGGLSSATGVCILEINMIDRKIKGLGVLSDSVLNNCIKMENPTFFAKCGTVFIFLREGASAFDIINKNTASFVLKG